jgi:hypothetical protein
MWAAGCEHASMCVVLRTILRVHASSAARAHMRERMRERMRGSCRALALGSFPLGLIPTCAHSDLGSFPLALIPAWTHSHLGSFTLGPIPELEVHDGVIGSQALAQRQRALQRRRRSNRLLHGSRRLVRAVASCASHAAPPAPTGTRRNRPQQARPPLRPRAHGGASAMGACMQHVALRLVLPVV